MENYKLLDYELLDYLLLDINEDLREINYGDRICVKKFKPTYEFMKTFHNPYNEVIECIEVVISKFGDNRENKHEILNMVNIDFLLIIKNKDLKLITNMDNVFKTHYDEWRYEWRGVYGNTYCKFGAYNRKAISNLIISCNKYYIDCEFYKNKKTEELVNIYLIKDLKNIVMEYIYE